MKRLLFYCLGLLALLSQTSCGFNGMTEREQAVKDRKSVV